jgi:hypothetical protein
MYWNMIMIVDDNDDDDDDAIMMGLQLFTDHTTQYT